MPFSNISLSTFAPVAVAPWVFDIYRDPKERLTRSNGDYEWIYGPILQLGAAHAATFVKYPKKDIWIGNWWRQRPSLIAFEDHVGFSHFSNPRGEAMMSVYGVRADL
jgi:hypothetical protein